MIGLFCMTLLHAPGRQFTELVPHKEEHWSEIIFTMTEREIPEVREDAIITSYIALSRQGLPQNLVLTVLHFIEPEKFTGSITINNEILSTFQDEVHRKIVNFSRQMIMKIQDWINQQEPLSDDTLPQLMGILDNTGKCECLNSFSSEPSLFILALKVSPKSEKGSLHIHEDFEKPQTLQEFKDFISELAIIRISGIESSDQSSGSIEQLIEVCIDKMSLEAKIRLLNYLVKEGHAEMKAIRERVIKAEEALYSDSDDE